MADSETPNRVHLPDRLGVCPPVVSIGVGWGLPPALPSVRVQNAIVCMDRVTEVHALVLLAWEAEGPGECPSAHPLPPTLTLHLPGPQLAGSIAGPHPGEGVREPTRGGCRGGAGPNPGPGLGLGRNG